MKRKPAAELRRQREAGLRCTAFGAGLTIVGEVLSQVEEGQRHQDVEGPVDSGGAGVPRAPRPERVDLRVDGPRHWAHTWRTETKGVERQRLIDDDLFFHI